MKSQLLIPQAIPSASAALAATFFAATFVNTASAHSHDCGQESTATESAPTAPAAANSAVHHGGASHYEMSEAGPPSSDVSGTSYGYEGSLPPRPGEEPGEEKEAPERAPASTSSMTPEINMETTAERDLRAATEAQHRAILAQQEATQARREAEIAKINAAQALQRERTALESENRPSSAMEDKREDKTDRVSPFDTEPYSVQPQQVGSVQITGKDKSVSVLEGPKSAGDFVDPAALRFQSQAQSQSQFQ